MLFAYNFANRVRTVKFQMPLVFITTRSVAFHCEELANIVEGYMADIHLAAFIVIWRRRSAVVCDILLTYFYNTSLFLESNADQLAFI